MMIINPAEIIQSLTVDTVNIIVYGKHDLKRPKHYLGRALYLYQSNKITITLKGEKYVS